MQPQRMNQYFYHNSNDRGTGVYSFNFVIIPQRTKRLVV